MRTILLLLCISSSALADRAVCAIGKLDVTSRAFQANAAIPIEYTCDGSEVSPPLAWSTPPRGTRSIAIHVEDADEPQTFTHWIVTNLPPSTTSLAGGAALPRGAISGRNDDGKAGWTGPCPASGRHRYVFRVYALDIPLARQVPSPGFEAAITGHVLAVGVLVGTYQKQYQTLVMGTVSTLETCDT